MPDHITKAELIGRIEKNPLCVTKVTVLVGDRVNVAVDGIKATFYWCSLKPSNQPRGNQEMNALKSKLIGSKATFVWCEHRNRGEGTKYYFEKGILVRQKAYNSMAVPVENVVKVDLTIPASNQVVTPIIPSFETATSYWEFAGLNLPVRTRASIPEILHSWIPTSDNGYVHQKDTTRRIMSSLIRNKGCCLRGHTGTGKTECLRSLAYHTGNPFIIIPCSADLETSNLLGYNTVDTDNAIVFIEGLLTTAVRYGAWVYFDEFNALSADITTALNPLLDGSKCLVLTENKGIRVPAHSEFRFLASGNPATHASYTGTRVQNLSLTNRLTTILIDYLEAKSEERILTVKFSNIPSTYIVQMVKIANEVRKLFKQNDIQAVMTTRDLQDIFEDMAILKLAHGTWDKAIDDALASWVGKVDYQTDAQSIYSICTKNLTAKPSLMEDEVKKIIS